MTTHHVPQQRQLGRSRFPWEWPVLIILLLLIGIVTVLLIRQLRDRYSASPLPTPMAAATVPAVITEPQIQLSPASGAKGTQISVWGRGWQPNDTVNVCLDDLGDETQPPIYTQANADGAGQFFATFTFPTNVQWRSLPDVSVVAESTTSDKEASAVFKLLSDTLTPTSTLEATPQPPATATATSTSTVVPPTPTCVYGISFVADISIADDTVIPPGVGFLKTWRIRNSGNCPWPAGTNWVFVGGSQMGGPDAVPVAVTNPGETADVSVYLITPTTPGTYIGYWTLRLPDGRTLSQRYFVRIIVPAPTATALPPTATPLPITPTPVVYNWRGEYFNNTALSGTPVLVRDDTVVDFNWNNGAPAPGLPADNFSARWTRSLYFDGGTYRFYARGDDGLRLRVDNNLILNEWHEASSDTYMAEVPLGTGNHFIQIEFYEAFGIAQIEVWWQGITSYPDWRGEYWSNDSLNGPSVLVRNDTNINFDWSMGAPAAGLPADNFSVRWTRSLPLAEGHYRFHVAMDDGLRLFVDNTLLINEWRDGSRREMSADLWLAGGRHDLRVEYYEHVGAALVQMEWQQVDAFTEWRGQYWANKNLAGRPDLVRNDEKIDFDWGEGSAYGRLPADEFSARWTRTLNFVPGTYRFYVRADDGVQISVDTQRVISEWHNNDGKNLYATNVVLDGWQTLIVEYFEDKGEAQIHFWYERIGDKPVVPR